MYDSFAVLQFFLVFTALFWEGEHSSKTCVSPTTSQGHTLCLMQPYVGRMSVLTRLLRTRCIPVERRAMDRGHARERGRSRTFGASVGVASFPGTRLIIETSINLLQYSLAILFAISLSFGISNYYNYINM